MYRISSFVVGLLIASVGVRGQTAQFSAPIAPGAASAEFEVASIKQATLLLQPGAPGLHHLGAIRNGVVFRCDYCTVALMISEAYSVKSQLVLGPSWLSEDTFQVDARMPPGTSTEQYRQMLQRFLADRFGLKSHREQRPLNGFSMVLATSKLKLEKAEKKVDRFVVTPGQIDNEGMSMAEFAYRIASLIGSQVIDNTGLDGFYRIHVKWEHPEDDKGPESQIYAAVKAQLGLALKSEKLATDVIVVDKANRAPIPN